MTFSFSENLKGLKYYFLSKHKGKISNAKVNDPETSGYDLFNVLETADLLSETNSHDLVDALESVKCEHLARKLRDFSKSHAALESTLAPDLEPQEGKIHVDLHTVMLKQIKMET